MPVVAGLSLREPARVQGTQVLSQSSGETWGEALLAGWGVSLARSNPTGGRR
jgi:hypothetical protein